MSFTELLWVTIPALSAALYAAILYARAPSWKRLEPAERWLMIFVGMAALWGLSSVLFHAAPEAVSPNILVRLVAIFNFGMPLTVFGFTTHFLAIRWARRLVPPGILIYTILVGLIIQGSVVYNARVIHGVVYQDYGPAMVLAAIYWVFFMYGAGLLILQAWRHSNNLDYRGRLSYLLGVIVLLTVGNSIDVTPLQRYPLDQLCAAFAAGLLALSLMRTRARHTATAFPRVVLIIMAAITYVTLIASSTYLLAQLSRWSSLIASVIIAIVSGALLLSYMPVRRRVIDWAAYLFFETYNVRDLLYRITTKATHLRLPQELGSDILRDMQDVLGLSSAVLVLKDEIAPIYRPVVAVGEVAPTNDIAFKEDSPLFAVLASVRDALTIEELAEHPEAHALWIQEWENLHRLKAEVIVSIKSEGEIVGFFALGSKLDGSAYTARELKETLPLVANQIAIALANSRLYAQVQREAELLAKANKELKEVDRIKTEIIQNVSHELRTPLTLIQGYAELLSSGTLESNEEVHEAGQVILQHARHLYRLVEDLLSFQRLEREPIQLAPFDLRQWLETAVRAWEPTMAKAHLHLFLNIADPVRWALGNPEHLQQVIDNLLQNARKFSPEGGRIWVRAWQREGEVYISVADEGIGVPKEKLPYLFERFYQVDGSTSRRFGGMGIGLALVKEIVERHGGRVWAESEGPGTGLTLTFTLRAITKEREADPQASAIFPAENVD